MPRYLGCFCVFNKSKGFRNIKRKGSDIVVELDNMKQAITAYNEPMIEMRDSL